MKANRTRELLALSASMSALSACSDPAMTDAEHEVSSTQAELWDNGGTIPFCTTVNENPLCAALTGSKDWPSAGHDWAHTGHNTGETAIGKANVAQLTERWRHNFSPAPGLSVGVVATPVTAGGIVYIADGGGFVHAKTLADGSPLWTSYVSTASPDPIFQAVILGAPVVTDDAIFVGDSDANIVRVNRANGAVQWSKNVDADPGALIQGDLATRGNQVIFGVASFENVVTPVGDLTHRGSVAALNTLDGSLLWQLYTTSDQALAAPKLGAGVGVWSSPAIDLLHGNVLIGTGQYYEAGSNNPSTASKKDLDLSDSLLSINMATGKLTAKRQFTAGDIYGAQYPTGKDYDVGTPPNLFPAFANRELRLAVGVGDKEGTYYAMDSATLSPLWQYKVAQGSQIGGFQSTAAYAHGVVFVAAHERITGESLQTAVPPGQSANFLLTPEGFIVQQKAARTNIIALNASTGAPIWHKTVYGPVTYAPLIVANGVLYHGDANGGLRGLDTANGNTLFETQIGGVPDGAGGVIYGNIITAMSLSDGRLLVSSSPLVPDADAATRGPNNVLAFGLPN